jgi:hypothetical protein
MKVKEVFRPPAQRCLVRFNRGLPLGPSDVCFRGTADRARMSEKGAKGCRSGRFSTRWGTLGARNAYTSCWAGNSAAHSFTGSCSNLSNSGDLRANSGHGTSCSKGYVMSFVAFLYFIFS